MPLYLRRFICIVFGTMGLTFFVCAGFDYSDPQRPERVLSVHRGQTSGSSVKNLFSVRAQERQLLRIVEALEGLPELAPAPRAEHYGHHSAYHVKADGVTLHSWVEITELHAKRDEVLEGVAMVPAFNPKHDFQVSYGFPQRFKIELATRADPTSWITVVDWTEADFPNPGLYPVFFALSHTASRIRLTVTKGAEDAGRQYFALAEFMVFTRGINIVPNLRPRLRVSDTYEAPPFWDSLFIADRETCLGPALMPQRTGGMDFINRYSRVPEAPPWVEIDLEKILGIGRLEILTAQAIDQAPVEGYGFPLTCRIELFDTAAADRRPVLQQEFHPMTRSGIQWLPAYGKHARYVRLTALELPVYDGESVFALGEIRVMGSDGSDKRNFAAGKVVLQSTGAKGISNAASLVDGLSNGRKIISEMEFIIGLAKAKVLERERSVMQAQLERSRIEVQQNGRLVLAGLAALLLVLMGGVVRYQKRQHRAILQRLRQQLAADLHDEIGANLGSISMVTSYLADKVQEQSIRKKLAEVGHIAQESFSSVQELIWLMDAKAESVGDLLDKLQEIAERTLVECEVSCNFPDVSDERAIPLGTRKSVLLLFKEALYNCAKYAQAEHVCLSAEIVDRKLLLSVEDDGEGFDLSAPVAETHLSGRGLQNMQRRASLMGAELQIHSELEKGTKIVLIMPLK